MNYIQIIANAYFWAWIITQCVILIIIFSKHWEEEISPLIKISRQIKASQGKFYYNQWGLLLDIFLFILASMLR